MPHKIKDISETLFRWLSRISQDDYEHMPSGISDWDTKDWQVSKTIIFMHGMGPLWGYHITKGWSSKIMPLELSDYLEQQFFENTKRIELIHTSYDEIGQKLDEAKIKYLPFKGIVLAEKLYPHIGCRPMADIDIYTGAGSAERVTKVMSEIGFVAPATGPSGITYYPLKFLEDISKNDLNKNWQEASVEVKDFSGESVSMPFSVDVHFSMETQNHAYSFNLSEMFEKARCSSENSLSTDSMTLYLLLHTAKHLITHKGRWIHLYDIFMLQNKVLIDAAQIAMQARKMGISHMLFATLIMTRTTFSGQKTELETTLEKDITWRHKWLAHKMILSENSCCYPWEAMFSEAYWSKNVRQFACGVIKLVATKKITMIHGRKGAAMGPTFYQVFMRKFKKIVKRNSRYSWRLLAAQGLNPRKDWK